MKYLSIVLVVVAWFFVIGGCKKNSSTSPDTSNYMKANINGEPFSITGISEVSASSSTSGGIHILYLRAGGSTGQAIRFSLVNLTTTGTVNLNTTAGAAYYFDSGFSAPYTYATSGTITITSLTPKIAGTFSFTTADSTKITEGSFQMIQP